MLRRLGIGMLLVAGAGCARESGPDAAQAVARPNVVLISVDTLRADRTSVHGYERATTPHLAELAREGVVFSNTLAQAAFTLTSHKSMLSGRYPARLIRDRTGAGLTDLMRVPNQQDFLQAVFAGVREELLVERLRAEGYATAGFTDGAWMARELGFDAGFDTFDDSGGRLAKIVPRVERWLAERTPGPFFLFVHTYDPHAPYHGPEPFNSAFCDDHGRHVPLDKRCNQVDCGRPALMRIELSPEDLRGVSDHYDGGVARADAALGRLFELLRAGDLYDEALILVTSDHGESLGEHGQVGHGGLYLEQLHVPLIVKPPRSWGVEARTVEAPVELVDVMPTVLEACGVDAQGPRDGLSLRPLILGQDAWPRRFALAQTAHDEGRGKVTAATKRALWEPGRWLLIHDARGNAVEFFDLARDPRGLDATTPERLPEVRAPLQELLGALAQVDRSIDGGEMVQPDALQLDAELERDLRALGY